MFDYQVMTEADAMKERFQLLNDGEYEATIKKVVHRPSAKGNDMFEIDLDVYDESGKPNPIKDYWVFTPKMMWKVIRGCDSAGVSKEYEEKKLCPELLKDLNVRVMVKTQEGSVIPPEKLNGKPFGSQYPTKNTIDDYIKRGDQGAPSRPAMPKVGGGDIPFNDDVPF